MHNCYMAGRPRGPGLYRFMLVCAEMDKARHGRVAILLNIFPCCHLDSTSFGRPHTWETQGFVGQDAQPPGSCEAPEWVLQLGSLQVSQHRYQQNIASFLRRHDPLENRCRFSITIGAVFEDSPSLARCLESPRYWSGDIKKPDALARGSSRGQDLMRGDTRRR